MSDFKIPHGIDLAKAFSNLVGARKPAIKIGDPSTRSAFDTSLDSKLDTFTGRQPTVKQLHTPKSQRSEVVLEDSKSVAKSLYSTNGPADQFRRAIVQGTNRA